MNIGGVLSGGLSALGLNPADAYKQASADVKQAAQRAEQFADLQWLRQMQGLQQAQGSTAGYRSLMDQIYGTNMGGQPMGQLQGPPQTIANSMPAMNMPPGAQPPAFAPPVRGMATGNYTGPSPDGRAVDSQPRTGFTNRSIPGAIPNPNAQPTGPAGFAGRLDFSRR